MQVLYKALTFDDILLVPAYSEVLPRDVSLSTNFTRNININIPLISSAMDTVTEARLAVALAQEGGIGIIHKNMSSSCQAKEVAMVKRHECGIVLNPIVASPNMKVRDAISLQKQHGISGLPVIFGTELMGIVTNRDLRFENLLDAELNEIMTPKNKLITLLEGSSLHEAQKLMHKYRLERVLIVNDRFELKGLVTLKDIMNNTEYPYASKDLQGRLLVGAAVGIAGDSKDRVDKLVSSGVDVLVVDTAHGHSLGVLNFIKWIKYTYPKKEVVAGNIATSAAAVSLRKVGVDAVKVGIGPGSICTTRIVAGVGVPQVTAIYEVARAMKGSDIPVIADGGIRYSGDIAKAIAAGASTCMIGSMFAGTEESPGEIILYQGRSYKSYRGMGSLGAMTDGSADRYFQENIRNYPDKMVPEGIEGRVPYKGSVVSIIYQITGGLRASMGYCGCKTIEEMHNKAEFIEITSAGVRESHVHDVQIVKEAPNYRSD